MSLDDGSPPRSENVGSTAPSTPEIVPGLKMADFARMFAVSAFFLICGWMLISAIRGGASGIASRYALVSEQQDLATEHARLRTELLAASGVSEAELAVVENIESAKWSETLQSLGTSAAKRFAIVLEVVEPLNKFQTTGDRSWMDVVDAKLLKLPQAEKDDIIDRATRFSKALDQTVAWKSRNDAWKRKSYQSGMPTD